MKISNLFLGLLAVIGFTVGNFQFMPDYWFANPEVLGEYATGNKACEWKLMKVHSSTYSSLRILNIDAIYGSDPEHLQREMIKITKEVNLAEADYYYGYPPKLLGKADLVNETAYIYMPDSTIINRVDVLYR